jgi:hypothetical protein
LTPTSNPNPLSNKDINIKDANNNIGALNFPGDIEDIREMEIGGPSKIRDYLAISFSNELLDPLITQVAENETNSETKSDDKDKVILSTHPLKASTSI